MGSDCISFRSLFIFLLCNLLCGISFMFRCYVKTKSAGIYDIQSKFNLRGLDLSSGMCEPVRIKHVCSPLSAFRQAVFRVCKIKFYLMIVCAIIFIEYTTFSCFDRHFEN